MSKKIPQSEFNAIIDAIALFPDGATLENILQALKYSLPRRSLQRRLAFLVKNNNVLTEGKARAQRYRPILIEKSTPMLTTDVRQNHLIPLSSAAESIKIKIKQPVQLRPHVSYNREFLDSYRPNSTYYLPLAVRQHLFELGKSSNGDRPAGTYARKIFHRLLIDLSWNSSRLEGNTYSLLETERLLALGEETEGKDIKETQMILNHKAAIEFLVESAEVIEVNRYTILNLHALLSNNLLGDQRACGSLRSIPVGIAKSVYHPLEIPQIIQECFNQILDTAKAIKDPFEQALFLMIHLPYLQPFEDVNKRVSRLGANIPLIRHNLSPLSFVGVSEDIYITSLLAVYELNKIELIREVFVWAYERSCSLYSSTRKALGEPDPFRLRYRMLISDTVASVVHGCMDKKTAAATIKERARESVASHEEAHFIEVVETEILSLHEGNIARYRLQPSEYEAWQKIW